MAGAGPGEEGRPERPVHRARRHGLRSARLLRQPDRDAELRRDRRERAALQQHAHDRAVLAEPLLHRHRAQPPRQRHGVHHRARDGIPGLQRRHAVRERDAVGDPRRAGLQHLHGRQVAPDAEQPGDRGRAVRPLAAGAGLRALLRLPRRRHEPVVSRPRLRQPPGRAAEEARGGLPPERGPGRQGGRVHRRHQAGPTRTSRSTCICASARRTPRITCAKEWADKYKGVFDDGWDAYREKTFARQKELGIVPADAELSRHDPDVPEWDSLPADGAAAVQPDDGGVRRLPRPHRPPGRPPARVPDDDSASSRTR